MAKVTGPALSLGATKSLGNILTFQKKGKGHAVYFKNKPASRAPYTLTPSQIAQRVALPLITKQWKTLSAEEKEIWEQKAKDVKYIGTGYHYFVHKGGIIITEINRLLTELDDFLTTESGNYIIME